MKNLRILPYTKITPDEIATARTAMVVGCAFFIAKQMAALNPQPLPAWNPDTDYDAVGDDTYDKC